MECHVRWNSTIEILLRSSKNYLFRTVLAVQKWISSIKDHLTPDDNDWAVFMKCRSSLILVSSKPLYDAESQVFAAIKIKPTLQKAAEVAWIS